METLSERPHLGDLGCDKTLVSVTTWIRGVCQHIDTTEKIRSSLVHSLYSSIFFHAIYSCACLRDHYFALPC
jgi:hypothetical protein